MKIKFQYCLPVVLVIASLLFGCKKVYDRGVDPEKEAFNFIVTDAQRTYINQSRGLQYEITNPVPELLFAGDTFTIDRFEIRGDNTLNFFRKGFSVDMDHKIKLFCPEEMREKKYEEFKLLAMVYDYTYIENSTAIGLFKEAGIWPFLDFFTEVRLNNRTQGVYHFIEDPVRYIIEEKNASFVVRRGYDHVIKSYFISPYLQHDPTVYFDHFEKIYSVLPLYSGKQLYDTLSSYMDMEQYFTKLSIDMLVKNGDYTDEIFFYTKVLNDREIFGCFPWDYDDIFADQPHEIGNDWATGTLFGSRVYNSTDDVLADVGLKLLYSVEDDLDYTIARDSYIYQQYLSTLRSVMEKIDEAAIDKIFDYTNEHIGWFYRTDSIIAQSKHDVNETNYSLFVSNLAEKRQMLKTRRNWILGELNIQQTK